MSDFTVTLPDFEGPLDLLLHLIEKRELDITQLSLAAVTDEFLSVIERMTPRDPERIADFLVVAARLLMIKSSALLPVEQEAESDEPDGEDLAAMLEAYRQYKQVASGLGERESRGLRSYLRAAPPPDLGRRLDPEGLSLDELFRALNEVLAEQPEEPESVDEVVRPLRITVRQRIVELREQLRAGEPLRFHTLLGAAPGRQEVIATFLAVLEILKLGWMRVRQEGLWGEIELLPIPDAIPDDESADRAAEIDEYV